MLLKESRNKKATCTLVETDEEVDDEDEQRALDQRPRDLGDAHGDGPRSRREEFGVALLVKDTACSWGATQAVQDKPTIALHRVAAGDVRTSSLQASAAHGQCVVKLHEQVTHDLFWRVSAICGIDPMACEASKAMRQPHSAGPTPTRALLFVTQ